MWNPQTGQRHYRSRGCNTFAVMFQTSARNSAFGSSWPISAEMRGFSELLLQPQDMTECVSLVKSLTEVGQRPHKQRQRHQLPFPPHEKPHLHQDH